MIVIDDAQRAVLLQEPTLTTDQNDVTVDDDVVKCFGGPAAIENIRNSFDEEGYLVVRGLLDADVLLGLEEAAQRVVDESANRPPSTFSAVNFGPVLADAGRDDHANDTKGYFRQVALSSAVPRFIARILLGLSPSASLRVLRDAFLAKGTEERHCGWHVDDASFWPATAVDPSPGVNAWVALDDIPASGGGGMAVSPRSHVAEWRHEAYRIIGSTQIFPEGGFKDFQQMFENVKPQTCNMIENGADMHAKIESTKVLPDYSSGDVLFCKRWLFHRSVPVNDEGQKVLDAAAASCPGRIPTFKRYTIRYEPGTTRLIEGVCFEPSILLNPSNGGRSLDDVCATDGPWYPQCWPEADEKEARSTKRLVDEKLPVADKIKQHMMKSLLQLMNKDKDEDGSTGEGKSSMG